MNNKKASFKHRLMIARRRITLFLGEHGIRLCKSSKGWPKVMSKEIEALTGIKRTYGHNQYHVYVASRIELSPRDLVLRTPPWADREAIKAIYRKCRAITKKTDIPYHVDHIVPIKGPISHSLSII